MKKRLFVLELA